MAESPAGKKAREKAGSAADRVVDAAVSSVPGGRAAAGLVTGKMNPEEAAKRALEDALTAKAREAIPGMGVFNLAKSLYDTGNNLAAGKKIDPKIKEEMMANALASATGMPPALAKVAMNELADNPNIKKGDFEKGLAGAAKQMTDVGQKAWAGASSWLSDTGLTTAFTNGVAGVTITLSSIGSSITSGLSGLGSKLPKGDPPVQRPGGDIAP